MESKYLYLGKTIFYVKLYKYSILFILFQLGDMLSFEIIEDIESKKLPIELYYRELKSYSENFEVL